MAETVLGVARVELRRRLVRRADPWRSRGAGAARLVHARALDARAALGLRARDVDAHGAHGVRRRAGGALVPLLPLVRAVRRRRDAADRLRGRRAGRAPRRRHAADLRADRRRAGRRRRCSSPRSTRSSTTPSGVSIEVGRRRIKAREGDRRRVAGGRRADRVRAGAARRARRSASGCRWART